MNTKYTEKLIKQLYKVPFGGKAYHWTLFKLKLAEEVEKEKTDSK